MKLNEWPKVTQPVIELKFKQRTMGTFVQLASRLLTIINVMYIMI